MVLWRGKKGPQFSRQVPSTSTKGRKYWGLRAKGCIQLEGLKLRPRPRPGLQSQGGEPEGKEASERYLAASSRH